MARASLIKKLLNDEEFMKEVTKTVIEAPQELNLEDKLIYVVNYIGPPEEQKIVAAFTLGAMMGGIADFIKKGE